MQRHVRPAEADDLPVLREMLFEAAYWRPGEVRPDFEEGLARPDLAKLLAGWGRHGDTAVVATLAPHDPIGAAWYRFWASHDHSYGFVSDAIPELAIGVRAAHRRRGAGAALLDALFERARCQRVAQLSLSVETDNPALGLYERMGFRTVARVGGAYTMVVDLTQPRRSERAASDTPRRAGSREPG